MDARELRVLVGTESRGLLPGEAACVGTPATFPATRSNMSAQAQMRAMLDQLMGTGRDGEDRGGGPGRTTCPACMLSVQLAGMLTG